MDFIDKDGVIHKNFPVWKAEKFGWQPVNAEKVKVTEEVIVKVVEEEE